MSLIRFVRQKIIQQLFLDYSQRYNHIQKILKSLESMQLTIVLDHFAIIDLPSPKTGIGTLNQIFSALNYYPQGRDYLVDKQNEFMWLAPFEAQSEVAEKVDPQVVIADFCLEDCDPMLQEVLQTYLHAIPDFPWRQFHQLCGDAYRDNMQSAEKLIALITHYCTKRDWPYPTLKDYNTVHAQNELLSWVLAFGRGINHFGINVRFLNQYKNLGDFNHFVQHDLGINLNQKNGAIKGDENTHIAQSSTDGELLPFTLADAQILLPSPFIEFIWRAQKNPTPVYWNDYFTEFIGPQANHVVESVYHHA